MVHWETGGKFGHFVSASFCQKVAVSARNCCGVRGAVAGPGPRGAGRAVAARGGPLLPRPCDLEFSGAVPAGGHRPPGAEAATRGYPAGAAPGRPASPFLMAFIKVPVGVSPDISQIMAPRRPLALTQSVFFPIDQGSSKDHH